MSRSLAVVAAAVAVFAASLSASLAYVGTGGSGSSPGGGSLPAHTPTGTTSGGVATPAPDGGHRMPDGSTMHDGMDMSGTDTSASGHG